MGGLSSRHGLSPTARSPLRSGWRAIAPSGDLTGQALRMWDGSAQRLLLAEQPGEEEQRPPDHGHVIQINRVGKDINRKDQVGQRTPERELTAGAELTQRTFDDDQFEHQTKCEEERDRADDHHDGADENPRIAGHSALQPRVQTPDPGPNAVASGTVATRLPAGCRRPNSPLSAVPGSGERAGAGHHGVFGMKADAFVDADGSGEARRVDIERRPRPP